MPVNTRRSSRRKAGEIESEGDQSDSSKSLSSPRKRVSRAAKKISEEKIQSIPEETSNLDKIDASSPIKSKNNELVKYDQGSDIPQTMDITSVSSESVKSEDCSSKLHDSDQPMTQELIASKEESVEETTNKEVKHSKEKSAEETTSHCDVIKNVMEAYKQESTSQKRVKGMPKSGRPWKTEQTARFSNMRKDKPLKSSWQLKMAQKAEKLSVRKYQQELEEAKRQAILLKKQRRAEHQKKKEENQRKSEVVQVIKNPAKLKRMKKKQLRMIEKRP